MDGLVMGLCTETDTTWDIRTLEALMSKHPLSTLQTPQRGQTTSLDILLPSSTMEYMSSNDVEKRADEKTSHEGIGISQDGKAYKLIKLNYDIVIVVRTVDPQIAALSLLVLTKQTRSMIQHQCK
jgi:hypothetical protein